MKNKLRILCNAFFGILIPVIAAIFTVSGSYRFSDFVVLYVTPVLIKIWFVTIAGYFIMALLNRKKRPLSGNQTIFLSISFGCMIACYFANLFVRELITGKFHVN